MFASFFCRHYPHHLYPCFWYALGVSQDLISVDLSNETGPNFYVLMWYIDTITCGGKTYHYIMIGGLSDIICQLTANSGNHHTGWLIMT